MYSTARTACALASLWLVPAAVSTFHGGLEATCQAAYVEGRGLPGPLNREWVDRHASWVLHLDVEAAMQSTLGRFLLANREHLDLGVFEEIREQTGFDPLTDLKSVTVYGTRDQPGERVRLIRATPALDAAIAKMRQPDILVQAITTGTWSLEAWSQDDWKRFGNVTEGVDPADRVLVFSGNQFSTARALEVQAGRAPNLTQVAAETPDAAVAAKPPKGSILFIAADDVPGLLGSGDKDSVIAQLARTLVINIGEAPDPQNAEESACCVDVTLNTKNFADASQLAEVLRGAVSMGRAMTDEDASWGAARDLLDGIQFRTDGSSVAVHGRWRAESVLRALQRRQPRANEAPGAGGGGGSTPAPPWFTDIYPSR